MPFKILLLSVLWTRTNSTERPDPLSLFGQLFFDRVDAHCSGWTRYEVISHRGKMHLQPFVAAWWPCPLLFIFVYVSTQCFHACWHVHWIHFHCATPWLKTTAYLRRKRECSLRWLTTSVTVVSRAPSIRGLLPQSGSGACAFVKFRSRVPNCCSLHWIHISDLRRQLVGLIRVAAMVLIHNMDSDDEQLQIVSYEEPEAYAAASHSENRITTLDADKHGPSLKNALIGSASFYKSMLDNALLRVSDPDRGLAHFKDTLRPYFVKGVIHVFLWRFLQMFRTYRGQSEFVHWIGRFEIAQKRLLASWSGLLDLSDLPEAGTQAFTAAPTDEQRLHYNGIATDEDRLAYQQEIREQTITNRRTRHAAQFPLSDNLMSLVFLVQADLNEQHTPQAVHCLRPGGGRRDRRGWIRRIRGRSFKKGKPKAYGKKGGKDQDPASARGQKEKVMQHGKMTSKTQLSGGKAKEKAKRARKEWKVRILSKECLHGRARAKEMERAKEVNHFNNNSLHKQTLHRQHLLVPHKPPKNKKQPMPKKAGVMIMTPTGQMTGQDMNPIMDTATMEITPKVIGTIGLTLLPLRNWPNPRTSIQKVQTSFLRTDRRTRSTGSVFRPFACSDFSDTNL